MWNILYDLFEHQINDATVFVDVFCGGGSVFLNVLNSFNTGSVIINDKDNAIASFWKCLLDEQKTKELLCMIDDTEATIQEHSKQKVLLDSNNILEAGFAALFINRTSFSGILTSGPIGGKEQKGKYTVDCRWNPTRLKSQIENACFLMRNKCIVFNEDFRQILSYFDTKNTVFYCDSPYYEKGNSLYRKTMGSDDHIALSDKIKHLKNAVFVISYDKHEFIESLYSQFANYNAETRYSIKGENRNSWISENELLITNMRPHRLVR